MAYTDDDLGWYSKPLEMLSAVADLTQKANSATYDEGPFVSKAHAPPPKKNLCMITD